MKFRNTILAFAAFALTASADVINYDTLGSHLSCGSASFCLQLTQTSIQIGTMNLTYHSGSGNGVVTPSIINFGYIEVAGVGLGQSVVGANLAIHVNSTPPGSGGTLPSGDLTGTFGFNSSTAIITFSPNNLTTQYGTLPGVQIENERYQILQTTLGLDATSSGHPTTQTTIQGAVSSTPEPTLFSLIAVGLIGFGFMKRKLHA